MKKMLMAALLCAAVCSPVRAWADCIGPGCFGSDPEHPEDSVQPNSLGSFGEQPGLRQIGQGFNGRQAASRKDLPKAALEDAMPVLKKGWLESESAFVKRAEGEAKGVLGRIFPAAIGYGPNFYLLNLDFIWRCNSRDDFWDKSGVSGIARWEYEGWKYAAEFRACKGPLEFGYINITPADGDKEKMPKTKENFISLVGRLTHMRIEDAEEFEFLGHREFFKNLDIRPELQVPAQIKTTHTNCGRPVSFPEEVGAIFLQGLGSADLRYFPKMGN